MTRSHFAVSSLLLHCLFLFLSSFAHASTTTSTSSSYQSIRALDESGQSVQLQHASRAASQQGNLVMAIQHTNNNTIHVISIAPLLSPYKRASVDVLHSITPNTFLICSGVQADARWLVETLRQLHKQMQVQYGSAGAGWAQRLASLYRAVFWGVPEKSSRWHPVRGLELKRWGRPLGVQSILLEGTQLYALEPSGVILMPEDEDDKDQVVAIGKHSRDILRQWSLKNTKEEESLVEHLKSACEGILSRGTVLSIGQVGTNVSWQMRL